MPVKSIGKGGKADLLRTVSKKLERLRLHSGWIERILHARVPILRFNIQGMLCQPLEVLTWHCQLSGRARLRESLPFLPCALPALRPVGALVAFRIMLRILRGASNNT